MLSDKLVSEYLEEARTDGYLHVDGVVELIATLRQSQQEVQIYKTSAEQWMSESSLCEEENGRLREVLEWIAQHPDREKISGFEIYYQEVLKKAREALK